MARTAKQELLRALRSRSRKLPAVSDDAKKMFYEIARKSGFKWSDLQRKTRDGQNVFELKYYRVVIIDVRMLAANDRDG
jgi:DNA-directed RNA polymerase subunit H (RpoH/RPB5)